MSSVQYMLHMMDRTMGDFHRLGNKVELLVKILSTVFPHQEQLVIWDIKTDPLALRTTSTAQVSNSTNSNKLDISKLHLLTIK